MASPPQDRPPVPGANRRRRGFEPAGSLVARRIQSAGEKRGFAVTRVLTHWDEIAGSELARLARPVKIAYGRDGFGATLTLLVAPACGPQVEMARERLRTRVNAAYGYNAVSRIVLTQTSATGFAEAQAVFAGAPTAAVRPEPSLPSDAARGLAAGVGDDRLRAALEIMAQNVLSRTTGPAVQTGTGQEPAAQSDKPRKVDR